MQFVLTIMLFMIGSILGWGLEFFYRNIFERKKKEKLEDPGFLKGPYLPIYGFGVLILQYISSLNINFSIKIILFAILLTIIELITGIIFTKYFKIKLWNYSKNRFNYKGIICPLFSFFWTILGIIYYFLFYERFVLVLAKIVSSVDLTFILGIIYGIFLIDVMESLNIAFYIKKYRKDKNILLDRIQKYTRDRIENLTKTKFNFKILNKK